MTPIEKKLGLKEEKTLRLVGAPPDVKKLLAKRSSAKPKVDVVVAFFKSKTKLKTDLTKLKKKIGPSGSVWVCWLKGNVTDLSRDEIWAIGERVGLDSVASVSINDEWSGLRLMYPKSERH